MAEPPTRIEEPIVLFDGVCNLCNAVVNFVLDHERGTAFRFAPLQAEAARPLLERIFGQEEAERLREGRAGRGEPDSIVLIEGSRGWTGSTAALRIARRLRAPYRWLFAFVVVPRPLRDPVYRFVAKHRYRWFGKAETCRLPTPELKDRFIA